MEDPKAREAIEGVKQLIGFMVGKEEYGIDLLRVKEVIRMRQVTWLPKAPACVKGIINLRGAVIPIVDMRERFGLRQQESSSTTRVIVLQVERKNVGMILPARSRGFLLVNSPPHRPSWVNQPESSSPQWERWETR
jgi:purine-binding chemotaxis protein CheW